MRFARAGVTTSFHNLVKGSWSAGIFYYYLKSRRNLMTLSRPDRLRNILLESQADYWLFGTDLNERIKNTMNLQKNREEKAGPSKSVEVSTNVTKPSVRINRTPVMRNNLSRPNRQQERTGQISPKRQTSKRSSGCKKRQ